MRLHDRVEKLEGQCAGYVGPAAWIECEDGETADDAIARYEAENGPLGDQLAIVWVPVTCA